MASGLTMMVGGAIVNALAFSGINCLFSTMSGAAEHKRHDLALEKLQKDRDSWNQARLERIDYINEQLKKQGHAERNFQDVNDAMRQYYDLTGVRLDDLPPEPNLYNYLDDSQEESIKNGELALLGLGMLGIGTLAYFRKTQKKKKSSLFLERIFFTFHFIFRYI